MIEMPQRVLSTRVSNTKIDTIEVLWIKRGALKRYRVYTSVDDEASDSSWDLDPVDFDSEDDEELYRYLVESFWLLRISRSEIQRACDLLDQGVFITPVGASNIQSINEMGSLGVLLVEIFNRIQTIETSEESASEVLGYISGNILMIESLPSLPTSVRNSLHGCHIAYREMLGEAEAYRLRRNIRKGS